VNGLLELASVLDLAVSKSGNIKRGSRTSLKELPPKSIEKFRSIEILSQ